MVCAWKKVAVAKTSPSMRREWIEMNEEEDLKHRLRGLPPCGGSGLKCKIQRKTLKNTSLPPCGGSGLKFFCLRSKIERNESPSMRREWIEIPPLYILLYYKMRLPPCGGSGLKSAFFASLPASFSRLPPCGGSGLKCFSYSEEFFYKIVSLHAEGVD